MISYIYGQLTRVPRQFNEGRIVFKNVAETTGYPMRKMKLDSYLIPYTKINPK